MEQIEETWWPAKEEYDPEISKDKWTELLHDEKIFDFNSMCMMHRLLDIGGQATNSDLSKKYGTKNGYNGIEKALAKRIIEKANCKLPPQEENAKRWPVLFVGRKVKKNDEHKGAYIWKLRPELEEALKQMDANGELEKYPLYEKDRNYYVISPNVWNDDNYNDLLTYMENEHCVLMGWGTNKPKGKLFSDLRDGDCVLVARRKNWKFSYYFLGIIDSQKTEKYKEAQKRNLRNFILLENNAEDLLKNWSVAGSSQIPAISKIDKNKNPEIIDAIDSILLNGDQKMSTTSNSLTTKLADLLLHAHNLILHGAPGTGKTHLAHEIAKAMNAETSFVQFHPSYDYTDFVEGLRPKNDKNGNIGFERKDGVFKEFCKRALKNLTDSKKSVEDLQKEISTDEQIENFLEKAIDGETEFEIAHGNKFKIEDSSDKSILISIPANKITNDLSLPKNDLVQLLNSDTKIESGADIKSFFNRKWRTQQDSYILTLYNEIKSQKQKKSQSAQNVQKIEKKNFLFIIDEINRGELSKIFGELFYAIEPGYRGEKGRIQTQYQNLVEESDVFKDGFFIPENVYIIGTMNDIDRSVDTMDFAFRRRFTFYEVKAEDTIEMLDEKTDENGNTTGLSAKIADEAKNRMTNLNNAISAIEGLNSSYHIGGAYFLKLNELGGDFEQLWNYHLEGLLREYLRGRDDAEEKLDELKKAYDSANHSEQSEESADE